MVFGLGKSPEQIAAIASSVLDKSDRLLVTRTTPEAFESVSAVAPDATHHEVARAIVVDRRSAPELVPASGRLRGYVRLTGGPGGGHYRATDGLRG